MSTTDVQTPLSQPGKPATTDLPAPRGPTTTARDVTGVPPPSGAWQGVSWFAFVLGATTFFYTAWYAPTPAGM